VLLFVVAAITAQTSDAGTPVWTPYYAVHQPMSLQAPPAWTVHTLDSNQILNVWNPTNGAYVEGYVIDTKVASSGSFFKTLESQVTGQYLQIDPKASVRWQIVNLPAGQALEVIVQLNFTIDGSLVPTRIQNYNFVVGNTAYDVVYECNQQYDSVDIPVFNASAQTIRVGHEPAAAALGSTATSTD
jgi:hypothetical protein